ncbi:hypothetical protein SASPL_151987 [Salvia splendens]|uniref:Mitochondrial outer membrane protein porin n=1 Tax=Salvia splendens TaxID=180675 RepID=A0A8X8W2F4_SALSN|nr:hypothetical protein SASPL_151987 [Salvia splendens]
MDIETIFFNISMHMFELRHPSTSPSHLLTRDYLSDHKFSVSTCTESGVSLTSSTVKKGGYSSGDVQLQYASNNTAADLKVDTESNIAATLSVADIIQSSKTIASLKYPNYDSGKLEFQYFQPHASLTASVSLHQTPPINFSATLGTPTFALGAEAAYETSYRKLTKHTAGITGRDKGDMLTASFIHYVDQSKRSAAGGEIARKFSTNHNTFTVEGSYALDDLMHVKFKLNNHGTLDCFAAPNHKEICYNYIE